MSFALWVAAAATATAHVTGTPIERAPLPTPAAAAPSALGEVKIPADLTAQKHVADIAGYALDAWRAASPARPPPLNDFDRGELRLIFDRVGNAMATDMDARACSLFALAFRHSRTATKPQDASYLFGTLSLQPSGDLKLHKLDGRHGLPAHPTPDEVDRYHDLHQVLLDRNRLTTVDIFNVDPRNCTP